MTLGRGGVGVKETMSVIREMNEVCHRGPREKRKCNKKMETGTAEDSENATLKSDKLRPLGRNLYNLRSSCWIYSRASAING